MMHNCEAQFEMLFEIKSMKGVSFFVPPSLQREMSKWEERDFCQKV